MVGRGQEAVLVEAQVWPPEAIWLRRALEEEVGGAQSPFPPAAEPWAPPSPHMQHDSCMAQSQAQEVASLSGGAPALRTPREAETGDQAPRP